jgi:hypothetical protein
MSWGESGEFEELELESSSPVVKAELATMSWMGIHEMDLLPPLGSR